MSPSEDTDTIHAPAYDSRAIIQEAYHDCYEDIIEYNCYGCNVDDYGPTFKASFYRHFQRLYYLSRQAYSKRCDAVLVKLFTDINAWIEKLQQTQAVRVKVEDIKIGHQYFKELEPYLIDRNLVVIAEDMRD